MNARIAIRLEKMHTDLHTEKIGRGKRPAPYNLLSFAMTLL